MTVVISVGGSIIGPDGVDVNVLKSLAEIIQKHSKKEKCVVVTGGGALARKYISVGREMGVSEYVLDEIGILATKVHAHCFIRRWRLTRAFRKMWMR